DVDPLRGARVVGRVVGLVVEGVAVGWRKAAGRLDLGRERQVRAVESGPSQRAVYSVHHGRVLEIGVAAAGGVEPRAVAGAFAGSALQVDRVVEGAREVEQA